MKNKKYLLKISAFALLVIVGLIIVYRVRTPVLNNKEIRHYKKKYTRENDYIDKIKFEYHEAGLEIQYYVKDVTEDQANLIVEDTQKFVTNEEFIDYSSEKYRKKYKNITRNLSDDYAPPATIVIYDASNKLPIHSYSADAPYTNWSPMN